MASLRSLSIGVAGLVASALLASAASAVPTYSFLYSGTTGTGATGGSTIAALPGDIITLDVLIHTDEDGFSAWSFDLLGLGVTAISGVECPEGSSGGSSVNYYTGTCFTTNFYSLNPLPIGVTLSGSDILGFDASTLPAINGQPDDTLFAARAVFQVTGPGQITLSGEVYDGAYVEHPLLMVPEPATAGMMALGLAALGRLRRRPRGACRGCSP